MVQPGAETRAPPKKPVARSRNTNFWIADNSSMVHLLSGTLTYDAQVWSEIGKSISVFSLQRQLCKIKNCFSSDLRNTIPTIQCKNYEFVPHQAALGIKYPQNFGDLLLIKEFRQSHHCIYYYNITVGYNILCIKKKVAMVYV